MLQSFALMWIEAFSQSVRKVFWSQVGIRELSFPVANWEAMDFEYIVIRYAMQVICDQIWEKGPWHTFWNVHASKMHISVMVWANLSKLLTVYRGEVPTAITPKWCFKTVLSVSYGGIFDFFFSGKCDRMKASDLEHGLARLVLVLYREPLHYHIRCRDMIVSKTLKLKSLHAVLRYGHKSWWTCNESHFEKGIFDVVAYCIS